jgi:hypothetical protein
VRELEAFERAILQVHERDKGIAYGDIDKIMRMQSRKAPLSYEQGRTDEQYAVGPSRETLELLQKTAALESSLTTLTKDLKQTQRAMHEAGYKSAAAMLNPIVREL